MKKILLYFTILLNSILLSISCSSNYKNETITYIEKNFSKVKLINNDTLIILLDNQCLNCINLKGMNSINTYILSNISLDYLKDFPLSHILANSDPYLSTLKEIDYQNGRFVYKNNKLILLNKITNVQFFK